MKIFCFNLKRLILIAILIVLIVFLSMLLISTIYQTKDFSYELEDVFLTITSQDDIQEIINSDQKIAYLTFDDGPTEKMTPKILDILEAEDISATFFVVGKHVKENPEIVKREYEDGHYIANHSYSHSDSKIYKSTESFINEITKTDEAIAEALDIPNYCAHLFRFPEGFMSPQHRKQKDEFLKVLSELDYSYVDWNCLNRDSEKKFSSTELMNNLIKTSKDKNSLIILMHDTGDVNDTDKVLKQSIDYLKKQGYVFRNFYDFIDT